MLSITAMPGSTPQNTKLTITTILTRVQDQETINKKYMTERNTKTVFFKNKFVDIFAKSYLLVFPAIMTKYEILSS